MEGPSELEKLIAEGFGIDFRDQVAIQNWWFSTYLALTAFPEEQYRFKDVFLSDFLVPEKQIERGLEILNEVLESLNGPHRVLQSAINCE